MEPSMTRVKDGAVDMEPRPSEVVESVLRALRLLELFQEFSEPSLTLNELVGRSQLTKSTVLRLMRTLEYAGWVSRPEPGVFRLTAKSFSIGAVLVESLDLHKEARPFLVELAKRANGTAFLWVLAGANGVCVDRVDGGPLVPNMLPVGHAQPLNLGAGPRTLLAYSEKESLVQLRAADLVKRTEGSLSTWKELREDSAVVRDRGYALSMEDVNIGIAAVGAPVFDRFDAVVGAVSIAGTPNEYSGDQLEGKVAAVVETARQLSHRLGHQYR